MVMTIFKSDNLIVLSGITLITTPRRNCPADYKAQGAERWFFMKDGVNVQVFLRDENGSIDMPEGFKNAFVIGLTPDGTTVLLQNGPFCTSDCIAYLDGFDKLHEQLLVTCQKFVNKEMENLFG